MLEAGTQLILFSSHSDKFSQTPTQLILRRTQFLKILTMSLSLIYIIIIYYYFKRPRVAV